MLTAYIPYLRGDHVDTTYYFVTSKANNCVGISHQGILQRSLFFGFCIEKLYLSDITSILSTAYQQYFAVNLGFDPLKGTVNKDDFSKMNPSSSIVTSPRVEFSKGVIYLEGLENSVLIDKAGREIMKLNRGENSVKERVKNGVYFVRGFVNNKIYVKSLMIL